MKTSKRALSVCWVLAIAGCGKSNDQGGSFQTVGRQPDVAPVMLNKELPFRYPPALFAQKVQGNVTLRIYIDRAGQIVPDSTHVAETSGFSALDSAAVKGSRDLKFEPAKTQDQPVPVSILLPVFFRYPGAPPLPGDSVLKLRQAASSTPPSTATASAPVADSATKPVAAAKKPTTRKAPVKSRTRRRTPARRKRG
jgi:TonB family protein